MSAEPLRRAASLMRNNNASFEHKRTEDQATFLAVADWLDACAESYHPNFASLRHESAFTVARAYLGDLERYLKRAPAIAEDDEKFCAKCFAGMESSEHHEKCDTA